MSENHATYTIQPGDCLSALAEKWHTTVDKLIELNRQDILDPDLIYAGNTLNVPERISLSDAGSEPLPEPPPIDPDKPVCAPKKYAEIVFVPKHPKTDQPAWMLLTKKAKTAFETEAERVDKAIHPVVEAIGTDGHESALKQSLEALNRLGLLESFKGASHVVFLEKDIQVQYETAKAELKVMQAELKAAKDKWVNGLPENQYQKLNQELIDKKFTTLNGKTVKDGDLISEVPHFTLLTLPSVTMASPAEVGGYVPLSEEDDNDERAWKTCYTFVKAWINGLEDQIDKLQKQVDDWESEAEKKAKKLGYSWDSHLKAYAEKNEVSASKKLPKVIEWRKKIDEDFYTSKDGSGVMKYWETWTRGDMDDVQKIMFFVAVEELNDLGFVVREQCLSNDQLFAHSPDWLTEGAEPDREQLQTLQVTEQAPYTLRDDLGFYVCTHLLPEIKRCIADTIADLKTLLHSKEDQRGNNPVAMILKPLLSLEAAVKNRLKTLKGIAENYAVQANAGTGPAFRNLSKSVSKKQHLSLIWDETDWKPPHLYQPEKTDKTSLAYNPVTAKLVECYTVDQGSHVRFIRDSWLLDEEKAEDLITRIDGSDKAMDALGVRPGDKIKFRQS